MKEKNEELQRRNASLECEVKELKKRINKHYPSLTHEKCLALGTSLMRNFDKKKLEITERAKVSDLAKEAEALGVKENIYVNLRTDLMFENIEAIWAEIRQGDSKYLVSCIYRPPSATKEDYERVVDMFKSARMTEYPIISLGNLKFDYVMNETLSTNPIYYIETTYQMRQLIDQPTRVDDKTSSILDVILTLHPELHRKSVVLKYTLSDHNLIYTHIEFKDTKSPAADHNTVRFRVEIFAHDLLSCDILNGSQDEDEILWEQWKSTYTEICDKLAPMKSLRLKNRSNPWITHDIIKLMYQRDNVHAKAIQKNDPLLWQNYRKLRNKVTCVIKERKDVYFSDINVLCRNNPKRM